MSSPRSSEHVTVAWRPPLAAVAVAGAIGTAVLISAEVPTFGGMAALVAVAFASLLVGPAMATVAVSRRGRAPAWLLPFVAIGVNALALVSGIVIPPGSGAPPPLWPAAVAAVVAVGLACGPLLGMAMGVLAAMVPITSSALSLSRLTPGQAGLHTVLVVVALLAGPLAWLLSPGATTPRPDRPGRP